MTHGVAATSGHLADNGGIRGHSAGPVFPFILYAQGTFDALGYWILQPNGLRIGPFKKWELAESFAMRLKMFGQLDPTDPTTADVVRDATKVAYTYYRDFADELHSPWRWRVPAGAEPDAAVEYTCNGGESWKAGCYYVREVRQQQGFVSLGSDPQWQEQ